MDKKRLEEISIELFERDLVHIDAPDWVEVDPDIYDDVAESIYDDIGDWDINEYLDSLPKNRAGQYDWFIISKN